MAELTDWELDILRERNHGAFPLGNLQAAIAAVRHAYQLDDEQWLRAVMFPQGPDGPHLYLSTGCLHGNGQHCRTDQALSGEPKQAATCKFCDARCVGQHHDTNQQPGAQP